MFDVAKNISPETATWIVGLVASNIIALISGIISVKVSIAKLEVKVDKLWADTNAIGGKIRKIEKRGKDEISSDSLQK